MVDDLVSTIQLEDVRTARGSRLLFRAVDCAAALAVAGLKIRYKKVENTKTGGTDHTWFCDSAPSTVRDLLLRAAIHQGPESLADKFPGHPVLVGLWAVHTLRVLEAWFCRPGTVPAAVRISPSAALCALVEASPGAGGLAGAVWASGSRPPHAVAVRVPEDAAFCAAAILCGFIPYPALTGPGVPHVHFANGSLTFPGLTLPDFLSRDIPGTPAGSRHPFTVALSAAVTWRRFVLHQERERRRTFLLRSDFGPRSAMISDQIMDESNGEARKAREEIEDHLASA